MKQKQFLFTDGSVNPRKNIGFGAYLYVKENDDYNASWNQNIKVKKFGSTSSTKLEIETMLWALKEMSSSDRALIVFTDCQNKRA